MATAPDGSAVLQPVGDGSPPAGGTAGVEAAALSMRLVAAAEAAAEAAKAATALASRSSADDNRSWWKLLPKPQVFDHSTREAEISSWKEWSWSFEQYISSVDSKFSDDVQQVRNHLNATVDPIDFSDQERQRNSFFYSLLSSLVRQRALMVVKQVPNQNGLEAYRLLIQQNEPLSKNRSMGLLNIIMNWPQFSGKSSFMQHILKLEHAYAEYEKLGQKLNDDLKTAVLMRSVTGQLKTWLQLQVTETTTYSRVREMILLYDASTTKWSEQMVLGVDASGSGDGPVPMEIDRIENKGKGKGAKGKSKGKESAKGKSGGKSKGKDGKGKGKYNNSKGSKGGGADERSKGKGKGDGGSKQVSCYNCGRVGHYAKDCWQSQVRNVSAETTQTSPVQGSPSSSVGGMSSVSQSGAQSTAPTQSAQRVARIMEAGDDAKHVDLVFDMRDSVQSSFNGSVHVVHFFIGDDDSVELSGDVRVSNHVRAVISEVSDDEHDETFSILLDSGADASIFPVSLLGRGRKSSQAIGRLCDAQGTEIPVESVQDMEIRMKDSTGKVVILREKVAVSSAVTQPILSFGRLLEAGWSIDGQQQALTHSRGANIPVELQNKSLMIQGCIRVLHEVQQSLDLHVRAIQAEVMDHVVQGNVGWELDQFGHGIGRHFDDKYQDPSLVKPDIPGRFCRTTLVEGDDKRWYVVELCERLDGLIQLDSEFYELQGKRNILTILTDGEKDPMVMGFKLVDAEPQSFPVLADDDDVEIQDDAAGEIEGVEIPEGQIMVRPSAEDEISVNGTMLRASSGLAALRAGCTFYGLSTSGSKQRCFQRLLDHQKKLELDMVLAASKDAQQQLSRQAHGPPSAELPSEAEQAAHRLTHVPYASWCPSCLAHRARPDRHVRSGESHADATPTISFDFFYTKADGQEEPDENTPDTVLALIMVCSQTSYTSCVPLQGKNQLDLMNRELIQFAQRLGHSEIVLRCDNEPAILQLQRLAAKTRQSMGLKTRMTTSVAYDHGNSLAENAIDRVRQLACSLMHQLHGRLGIQLSTSNAMWSWALRHSAFLISRFSVINGATPFELAFGRQFNGALCEYGEPVFAYIHPGTKATAKWKRVFFLGKSEDQNSYILFDGQAVVLSKNVRRISTTWRSHMAYYLHCKCYSWQYRSGFGSRVLPTMKRAVPKAVSFEVPLGPVEGSLLHDADAEAVIEYAEQKKKAEEERFAMAQQDPVNLRPQAENKPEDLQQIFDDEPAEQANPGGAAAGSTDDPGLMVPMTPPMEAGGLPSPRTPAVTHSLDDAPEDEVAKRAKVEESKRLRINRLKQEYEDRLTKVKIDYKEYFTMDDYGTDLNLEEGLEEDSDWAGEDDINFDNSPEQVWADFAIDGPTPGPPEPWIDEIADRLEVSRLVKMSVLIPASEFQGEVSGKLTTKFVRDWRVKTYTSPTGESWKRWMRRSRYVAREFASCKRLDTFSPATGAHTANLLPLKYLWQKQMSKSSGGSGYNVVLGCLDIKDAFLMVDQEEPTLVSIHGESFVIQKNLPGQRMGAKAWYQCLRKFLEEPSAMSSARSNHA